MVFVLRCVRIGRGRGTAAGLEQRSTDGDGAGVRVEQGGLQRTDGVKADHGETAGEAQGAQAGQVWIQVLGV